MKFFSRDLEFFFTGRKQKFVQIFCVFVQKIKNVPTFFRRESSEFPKTSGHLCKRKMWLFLYLFHDSQEVSSPYQVEVGFAVALIEQPACQVNQF